MSIAVSIGAYGDSISTAYDDDDDDDDDNEDDALLLLVVPIGSVDGMDGCDVG